MIEQDQGSPTLTTIFRHRSTSRSIWRHLVLLEKPSGIFVASAALSTAINIAIDSYSRRAIMFLGKQQQRGFRNGHWFPLV